MSGIKEYDLALLPPKAISVELIGMSIQGPRGLDGQSSATDFSAGGRWAFTLGPVRIWTREQHLYYTKLMFRLSGGTQPIIVPLVNDKVAPVISGAALYDTTPFGDGSTFGDTALFSQPSVTAVFGAAASLGAGLVTIDVTNGVDLVGGEIFGVVHPSLTVGHRCYAIEDVESVETVSGARRHVVALRTPLRMAVEAGEFVDLVHPRCRMVLRTESKMAWQPSENWMFDATFDFVEDRATV